MHTTHSFSCGATAAAAETAAAIKVMQEVSIIIFLVNIETNSKD